MNRLKISSEEFAWSDFPAVVLSASAPRAAPVQKTDTMKMNIIPAILLVEMPIGSLVYNEGYVACTHPVQNIIYLHKMVPFQIVVAAYLYRVVRGSFLRLEHIGQIFREQRKGLVDPALFYRNCLEFIGRPEAAR
jgi:hypothetical protein